MESKKIPLLSHLSHKSALEMADPSPSSDSNPQQYTWIRPPLIHSLKNKIFIYCFFSLNISIIEAILGGFSGSYCLIIDSFRQFKLFRETFSMFWTVNFNLKSSKIFTFGYSRFESIIFILLFFFEFFVIILLIVFMILNIINCQSLNKDMLFISAFCFIFANILLKQLYYFLKISYNQYLLAHKNWLNCPFFNNYSRVESSIDDKFSYKKKNTSEFLYGNSILDEPDEEPPFLSKESVINPRYSQARMSASGITIESNNSIKEIFGEIVIEAFLQLTVLINAFLIFFADDFECIDSFFGVFLAILLVINNWNIFKEHILILMNGCPQHINANIVEFNIKQIENIKEVHQLHLWSLNSGKIAVSAHISGFKGKEILRKSNEILRNMGFQVIALQIEESEESNAGNSQF